MMSKPYLLSTTLPAGGNSDKIVTSYSINIIKTSASDYYLDYYLLIQQCTINSNSSKQEAKLCALWL